MVRINPQLVLIIQYLTKKPELIKQAVNLMLLKIINNFLVKVLFLSVNRTKFIFYLHLSVKFVDKQ